MPDKAFRYAYEIQSKTQSALGKELDIIGNAFQNAGWVEVGFIPETGIPTHVIFEWRQEGRPVYPSISYP